MAVNLDLAIAAIRSGRREEGRQLLNLLIQQNPNDDKAWLWMSSVVETDEQRARCLYHVLAIDPNSQIARRGLQLLGIVLSDSRPVKIPRDSQPIKIPKPSTPEQQAARRPFLIDPQAITQELPFTPITAPFAPEIKASPAVLAIDVEAEASQSKTDKAPENPALPAPVVTPSNQPNTFPPAQPDSQPLPAITNNSGVGQSPAPHNPNLLNQMGQQPVNPALQPGQPHQPQGLPIPNDTRPSEPTPVYSPGVQYPPPPQMPTYHSNTTQGMPAQQWPPQPGYGPDFHGNTTLGMPVPYQYGQMRPPSEPVPVYHPNTTFGMAPYGQNPMMSSGQGIPLHASATLMMPTMSEAEARARLAASQAIPTSNAAAMAFQNSATAGQLAFTANSAYTQTQEAENEEDEGVNILAVVIFGTLSVTALGGLGMLILLMVTASV